jgi:quinol-cytochrome oxidoreductase complex cytochrome b subunit
MLLTAVHFWRIRKQGGLNLPDDADLRITESYRPRSDSASSQEANKQIFTWPTALWIEFSIFMIVLTVLILFAYLIDAPLKEQASTAIPENPAKAPWYFLGVQELVSYSALGGGLILPILVITTLFLIPYLDREQREIGKWFTGRRGLKMTILSVLFSLFSITLIMALVIRWGWIRDWLPDAPHWLAIFINPGSVLFVLYCIFAFFIKRRIQSTRMAIMSLFTALAVAYVIFTVIGIWLRGPDWQFGFWSFF